MSIKNFIRVLFDRETFDLHLKYLQPIRYCILWMFNVKLIQNSPIFLEIAAVTSRLSGAREFGQAF